MKLIKRVLLILLCLFLLLVLGVAALLAYTGYRTAHYYRYAEPAGEIEQIYTALGPYKTAYAEFDAENETFGKYAVWYPVDMADGGTTYPLVIMANGTGTKASQYREVFAHLASWGFIVAGNEDENSRTGASSAATLDFLLAQNADANSLFYGRLDAAHIGIAGHSQGGVGAINAVAAQPNGTLYGALFTASATSGYWGQEGVFGAEWAYDVSKLTIPYFMVAGTGAFDAGTAIDRTANEGQGICPLWSMEENYAAAVNAPAKAMARLTDRDHGDTLRGADGYMTAWFCYWLQGDETAGRAFFGADAELLQNTQYQDQAVTQMP